MMISRRYVVALVRWSGQVRLSLVGPLARHNGGYFLRVLAGSLVCWSNQEPREPSRQLEPRERTNLLWKIGSGLPTRVGRTSRLMTSQRNFISTVTNSAARSLTAVSLDLCGAVSTATTDALLSEGPDGLNRPTWEGADGQKRAVHRLRQPDKLPLETVRCGQSLGVRLCTPRSSFSLSRLPVLDRNRLG